MMNRVSRIAVSLTAACAAASLAVAGAWPAQAAASPGWRQVLSKQYPPAGSGSVYAAVVAPGRNDAWVFGGTSTPSDNAGRPVAEHWNGKKWRAAALPAGLTGSIAAASASSPSDIWAVSEVSGWVLHYNGSRWTVARRWAETAYPSQFTGVTAVSPRNVWVFGGVVNTLTGLVGYGTWHFNGNTWRKVTGEGRNVVTASALSASDIWAVGGYYEAYDGVDHYDGHSWKAVAVPSAADDAERDVLAVSANSVWVGNEVLTTSQAHPTLIHWNGRAWSVVAVHAPVSAQFGAMASDGHGGIWIEAQSRTNGQTWLLHRSASGVWRRTTLPYAAGIADLALIGGTTSLWGPGLTYTAAGSNATIWAYGSAG